VIASVGSGAGGGPGGGGGGGGLGVGDIVPLLSLVNQDNGDDSGGQPTPRRGPPPLLAAGPGPTLVDPLGILPGV
jgi:hypothetical protein